MQTAVSCDILRARAAAGLEHRRDVPALGRPGRRVAEGDKRVAVRVEALAQAPAEVHVLPAADVPATKQTWRRVGGRRAFSFQRSQQRKEEELLNTL